MITQQSRFTAILSEHFEQFFREFRQISAESIRRFERQDWQGQRQANADRIDLHERAAERACESLLEAGFCPKDQAYPFSHFCEEFQQIYADHPHTLVACAFLDAVIRKLLLRRGEFSRSYAVSESMRFEDDSNEVISVSGDDLRQDVLLPMLHSIGFSESLFIPDHQLDFLLDSIRARFGAHSPQQLQYLPQLFFRNKHAYLLGRAITGKHTIPFAIPFIHAGRGIFCDAFLTGEQALERIFAFSRSYLLVDSNEPATLLKFLLQLMPKKQPEHLLLTLGYLDAGKHMMLQKFRKHLAHSRRKIEHAPGIKGMVMIVFTMPDCPLVFKVIRDHIKPPKMLSRDKVLGKYAFVARHDRVGRMADAQLFDYLVIPVRHFDNEMLQELLQEASSSVTLSGENLILHQVLVEKKLVPLNIYLKQVDVAHSRAVALDYGDAIREMAMTNMFPGDLLIKNFGVSDEQRVVFYDYDEVCPLTDCNFRKMPEARYDDEMMSDEPWFSVNEEDVFPEEFASFLIPKGPHYQEFIRHHQALLDHKFWNHWKEYHLSGKILDIQPYESELVICD